VGWGFTIYYCSTEHFWRSGSGATLMREALGRLVVDIKYGSSQGRWCSNDVNGSYGVRLWKNIRRGWGSFLDLLDLRWVVVLR
jgi:hypothetical protein